MQHLLLIKKIRHVPSWFGIVSSLLLTCLTFYLDLISTLDVFVIYLIGLAVAVYFVSARFGFMILILELILNNFLYLRSEEILAGDTLLNQALILVGFYLLCWQLTLKQKYCYYDTQIDSLNPNGFLHQLEIEVYRSHRYQKPFTLAFLDCIPAKMNGNSSVTVKKENIRKITRIMKQNLRKTDTFTHITNGRFLILLPEVNSDGANVALQKLYSLIRLKSIAERWPFRLKIGAITFRHPPLDTDTVLASVQSVVTRQQQSEKFIQHERIYH